MNFIKWFVCSFLFVVNMSFDLGLGILWSKTKNDIKFVSELQLVRILLKLLTNSHYTHKMNSNSNLNCIHILLVSIFFYQGLCVATLFCFFNGEVMAQVKRKYRTFFLSSRARSNSYTATQVSVSIDFLDKCKKIFCTKDIIFR